MGLRPCCRHCRHCSPAADGEPLWCNLRQLALHPELAGDLWCHHWTARPPRLPGVTPGGASAAVAALPHQLSLAPMLPEF